MTNKSFNITPGVVASSLHCVGGKSSMSGFNFMELIIINRKGQEFIVLYDKRSENIVNSYKWYMGGDGYVRTVEAMPKLMHRLILGINDEKVHVDHKNRIKSDNRLDNLRVATRSQNMANKTSTGESKYLGVSHQRYFTKGRLYHYIIATIMVNGKKKYLGRHDTEEDAAKAYDAAAKIHHGEFANLNFK